MKSVLLTSLPKYELVAPPAAIGTWDMPQSSATLDVKTPVASEPSNKLGI